MAMGIPSAVTGLLFKKFEKKVDIQEKTRTEKEEKKDADMKKHELLLLRSINASLALGEATANAIRDGKCNGEMSAALKYARGIKHEQKNFLQEQAVENVL